MDSAELSATIHEMREKIDMAYFTDNPWDIKYVHGGLMDADFILQYRALRTGKTFEETLLRRSPEGEELLRHRAFLTDALFYLRLCGGGTLDEADVPKGLVRLLVKHLEAQNFAALKQRLVESERVIKKMFEAL